jgi:hypothetical protein
MNVLSLDNSKRSCWKECKRKYYYNYVQNIETLYGSTALRYGTVWHAGQEAFYKHIMENGWTRDGAALQAAAAAMKEAWAAESEGKQFYHDYRTLENGLSALVQYVGHYSFDEGFIEVLQVEEEFRLEMSPTEEEKKIFPFLKPFHFTGKRDLKVRLDGRIWIYEHKTTGNAIDDQVRKLHRSAQVMGYFFSEEVLSSAGDKPEGVLVSVHHLSSRKSKITGLYGAVKVEFRRVPQIFNRNDIAQWRLSFFDAAQEIQLATETNNFPMNHDSCFNYGTCPYLDICETIQDINELNDFNLPEKYKIKDVEWNPGKDVTPVTV